MQRAVVRVVVSDVEDPKHIVHDREGDHNYPDFREWIRVTTYWAVRNGYVVTITPKPL